MQFGVENTILAMLQQSYDSKACNTLYKRQDYPFLLFPYNGVHLKISYSRLLVKCTQDEFLWTFA